MTAERYVVTEEQIAKWIELCYNVKDTVAEARPHPLSDHDAEIAKKAKMGILKDLQKFIDNADSHRGCPNGTVGTAYLVQWMGGQGYDCD